MISSITFVIQQQPITYLQLLEQTWEHCIQQRMAFEQTCFYE